MTDEQNAEIAWKISIAAEEVKDLGADLSLVRELEMLASLARTGEYDPDRLKSNT